MNYFPIIITYVPTSCFCSCIGRSSHLSTRNLITNNYYSRSSIICTSTISIILSFSTTASTKSRYPDSTSFLSRLIRRTIASFSTSSHRRRAGSGSLLPRGMLAQTKEESEEEGETESDRDSTPRKGLDAGGGDPNAFGQLDRRQVSLNSSHRCQRAVH